ncbi:MAG: FtsX-like permease family protein [Candidatus Cloacimonetes bacterium]|jgi:lipoprotein-releasing system permease protein|nr:FtsX-like permease family protein [Candidatus Cloacimonadota bacterium]
MNQLEAFFLKHYIKTPRRNIFKFSFVFMVLGIALSVGILSAGLNLFQGYESNLKKLLLDSFAHINISPIYRDSIDEYSSDEILSIIFQKDGVSSALPLLQSQLMAQVGGKVRAANLMGFKDNANSYYRDYISQGKQEIASGEIIVGHYLAEELALSIGDNLTLMYPRLDQISAFGLHSVTGSFEIVGIYRCGYYENDRSIVICDIDEARDLLNLPIGYTKIHVKLDNPDKAPYYGRDLAQELNNRFTVIPWNYYAESLLRLVKMEKWLIFIVFSFLVLIAGINVISAVGTIILDKTDEIAILHTLGAKPKSIKRLFAYRVGIVAVIAVIIGQIFGLLLSWLVEKQGIYKLKGDVYFIDTLTFELSFTNLLVVFFTSTVLIFLCIMIPLKQIQKMQVMDIVRRNY